MADWPTVALSKLVDRGHISYGIVQPGTDTTDGVPVLRVKDLRDGVVHLDSPLRVDPGVSERHSKTLLQGGELLVSLVGSVGQAAIAPHEAAGWNVARAIAVLRPVGVSADWLRLCFMSQATKEQIRAALNTTVQATLNLSDLKKIQIPLPPEIVRRGITEVVGALDDKIAANLTLAKRADELATALFENAVRGVALSDRGFDDVAQVHGGGTPSSKVAKYWDGDILWATPTDVTALAAPYLVDTERKITKTGLKNCSSGLYPAGSILMTSRATIGAFALALRPTAVNQGFIVVVPGEEVPAMWLFHEMRSRVSEFTSMANGATFLELSRGNFKKFGVRLADFDVMRGFEKRARALHERAAAALNENAKLAATRDALLPGLMAGKLRVRDAVRVAEGVV